MRCWNGVRSRNGHVRRGAKEGAHSNIIPINRPYSARRIVSGISKRHKFCEDDCPSPAAMNKMIFYCSDTIRGEKKKKN